jgi:hypothetical protein
MLGNVRLFNRAPACPAGSVSTFKAMHWELLLLFPPRCLALEKLRFSVGWRETVEITRGFLPPAAANWREIKFGQTTVCEIVPNGSLKPGGKRTRLSA